MRVVMGMVGIVCRRMDWIEHDAHRRLLSTCWKIQKPMFDKFLAGARLPRAARATAAAYTCWHGGGGFGRMGGPGTL
jgi:hypothetical protein